MASNANQSEEKFSEAYLGWEIERLYADFAYSLKKTLSPNAKTYLRGILCGYSPKEIAEKLDLRAKDPSIQVRQILTAEVYQAVKNQLGINKIKNYSEIPKLLEQEYRKPVKQSKTIDIDWSKVSNILLEQQKKRLLTSYSLGSTMREIPEIYVGLELVEREEEPRIGSLAEPEQWSTRQQEKRTPISNDYFFDNVLKEGKSPKSNGKRIGIIGEAGAGKTTLLQKIASEMSGLRIWIDLADPNLKTDQLLEEYLIEVWLSKLALPIIKEICPEAAPNPRTPTEELKDALFELLQTGEVWLLLDGADEMASKFDQPLAWINRQLQDSPILKSVRIVLTCRLNIWSTGENYLPDFDVYRNLDFTEDQVLKFIEKWFINNPEAYQNLKQEIDQANERIKSLINNPLRLTLLCLTWTKGGYKLPETKAGLYQRFVEGHYKWKENKEEFRLKETEQRKMNRLLGELAKKALDSKDSRFRIRKSLINQFAEQSDEYTKTLELAIKLDWLVPIGLPTTDEKDADETVYAFYHPTFQEYFAALVIDDWRKEFLNHVPHNPTLGIYRIFKPQWKQVILFWLGRKNVDDNEKEKFIESLVYFEDGCNGFYWYKAYFLAANGMAEFHKFSKGKEIVTQVVNWAFMNNNTQILESIKGESRKILLETNNNLAIFRLLEISEQTSSYLLMRIFFSTFQKICFGNQPYIIDELTKLLRKNQQYKYKCCELLKLIALMGNGNNAAIKEISNFIDELEKLIEDEKNYLIEEDGVQYCKYQDTLIEAARTLGIIDYNNSKAIRILIELSKRCNNEALKAISDIRCESDDNIVNVLVDIITENDNFNSKINSLQALAKLQPNHSILVPELLNIITPTLEEIALRDSLAKIQQQSEYNFEENEYLELEFVYLKLPLMQGFEKNRKIALDALEEICKNNPHQQTNIIDELFELIYQCSDRTVIQEIIRSLARMGNHPIIIARFEKMLESKSKFNDYTLLTVAEGLKQIDRENQKASQTLVEMLDSKDKTLCILASNILGKLEIEEDDAIRALENKIESTDNSNIKVKVKLIYNLSVLIPNHDLVNSTIETINFNDLTEEEILTVAYDLFKIKEEKNILFNKLLELTFAKDRPKKLKNICFYLQRMITRENAKKIIHSYRDYCSNQFLSKNCKNSHEIDTLLWHCAQHMSYPEFYQAWHEPNTTQKQLENSYNDLTEILKQLQPTDQVYPILIDGKYSLENLTDESAIAQELCNKIYEAIFPDDDIPPVKNAPELKRLFPKFKRQLNILTLVFIIYNIEPYPELINVCRQLLGKFHIAFITHQQIEPDLRGFPMQKDLVNILQNWLTEISYKETF
ncbi:NACHT C-terminal alpha/beta 1 domain-containing protein [Planktothrix agardhii]|uniref:NACHT C-terminal alpha/beta 1 domain-containing protein n=1 Tax=Planktothrix agardhii TaxID=1160 RepID=UPI00287669E9|nr:NACHT domain-containing protein [Planktothrix agardhii]MDS1344490.1 NACHT domain-containing protein [Planktothrix agardhii NRERC-751]